MDAFFNVNRGINISPLTPEAPFHTFLLFTNLTKRVIYLASINNPQKKPYFKLMQNKGTNAA
jgi:hypothetical protein